jgi:hypothetical protein
MGEAPAYARPAVAGPRAWAVIPLEAYARSMPLWRARFTLETHASLRLPRFSGALWHGVLGAAVKRLACTVPPGVCRGCPERPSCPYPRLMEAESPRTAPPGPATGLLPPGARLPSPLILDTGPWSAVGIPRGGRFHLDLAIVGSDGRQREIVSRAVSDAVSQGLGRSRATARVMACEERPGLDEVLDSSARSTGTVRLRLVSPLRLKRRGAVLRAFDLEALARSLSWRLALLGHYHGRLPWPAPWADALEQARPTRIGDARVRWIEGVRYSTRQGREIVTGGLVGDVVLHAVGPELARLLAIGGLLHAGGGASTGLGQLEVEAQPGGRESSPSMREPAGGAA